MGVSLLQEIITILVGGIVGIAEGIGSGLNALVTNIFVATGEGGATTLSTYGVIVIVFAGVALAVGISRMVVRFLTSMGN